MPVAARRRVRATIPSSSSRRRRGGINSLLGLDYVADRLRLGRALALFDQRLEAGAAADNLALGIVAEIVGAHVAGAQHVLEAGVGHRHRTLGGAFATRLRLTGDDDEMAGGGALGGDELDGVADVGSGQVI